MSDPTALPNFPPPPDEHPLRGIVLDALQDMGRNPNIDGDGDVAFTVSDQQLFVRCSEGDFQIMRLFGQWQIGAPVPDDVTRQMQTCNELNLTLNMVKTGIANGTLVVTGEHLITHHESVRMLLDVTTQIVLAAVQMWHERITADPEAAQGDEPGEGSAE